MMQKCILIYQRQPDNRKYMILYNAQNKQKKNTILYITKKSIISSGVHFLPVLVIGILSAHALVVK